MNIYVNIVTEALKRTFWTQTTNMGVIERAKPIINMKSESKRGLLYTVMYIEKSFKCWNRKKSAVSYQI